ncbi:MAG: hypothetical protein A2W00_04440 [Candidatus Eisenbacteria bacterium RBG_16_71_46]|nr:MAG: hypothetical protein A2W00_04440 [Candidatus Eisenbacteria bacterium RBG_16_71_46]
MVDNYGPVRQVTLQPETTVTASGTVNGTAITGLGAYRQAQIALIVTDADTDVGDTLDVYVDTSFDGGSTWLNVVHFPQILGNGADSQKYSATLDPAGAAGTSTVDFTSDCNAGVVRPSIFGDQVRVRYIVAKDGDPVEDQSFTFAVLGEFKR